MIDNVIKFGDKFEFKNFYQLVDIMMFAIILFVSLLHATSPVNTCREKIDFCSLLLKV